MEGEITEEKNEGCVRVRTERLEERNGFKRRGKERELEVRKCINVIYFLEQQTPLGSKCCECCVDFGGASAADPTEGVAGAWRTEPWGTGAAARNPAAPRVGAQGAANRSNVIIYLGSITYVESLFFHFFMRRLNVCQITNFG